MFGSYAYSYISSELHKKFDSKIRHEIFIEYLLNVKDWRLYDPIKKTIFVNQDVVFDENFILKKNIFAKLFHDSFKIYFASFFV